jgi:hypothetical protein
MNTNMNPQNPDTSGGMPAPGTPGAPAGPEDPGQQPAPEPKTIRDYLAIARSQGQVPTFTNIDNAPGFDIRQDPSYIQDQAIPEGPGNEYEQEPWDQRVIKDPYIRTQQSLTRFLPQMFEIMFPGQEPGTLPKDSPEAQRWGSAVSGLTKNLLKRYSDQHNWELKDRKKSKEQRSKDEQYWQRFYATQNAKMQPVLNEDGSRMTEVEFIDKQMAIADERRMKSELGTEAEAAEAKAAGTTDGTIETLDDMEDKDIQRSIQKSPELAEKIKAKVVEEMSAVVGEQITDADFFAFRNDPRWQSQFREIIKRVIDTFEEDIVTLANGGQLMPSQEDTNRPSQILKGAEPGFAGGSDSGMDVPMGMS